VVAPWAFWFRAAIRRRPIAPVVASSGTRFPADLRPWRIAVRLLARWRVLPFPAVFSQSGVLLLLRVDELLARVAVIAAGAPIAAAAVPIRPLASFLALLPGKGLARAGIVVSKPRRLLGVPQLAARKPFHYRVGVFFPDAVERRQQFLALRCAERRRQPSRDDGPVRIARRHGCGSLLVD
jgi:hypothetical protein